MTYAEAQYELTDEEYETLYIEEYLNRQAGLVRVDSDGRYTRYEDNEDNEYEDYVHMRNAAWFRDYVNSLSPEELERMRRCNPRRRHEGKVDWKKEGF